MKKQGFFRRLRYAFSGIVGAFRTESSFRVQLIFTGCAFLLLIGLRPKPVWWALVLLSAAMVLAAELINTSLEHIADKTHPELHPMIARAKDCAAGAVLLLAIASLGVAAALVCESLRR